MRKKVGKRRNKDFIFHIIGLAYTRDSEKCYIVNTASLPLVSYQILLVEDWKCWDNTNLAAVFVLYFYFA